MGSLLHVHFVEVRWLIEKEWAWTALMVTPQGWRRICNGLSCRHGFRLLFVKLTSSIIIWLITVWWQIATLSKRVIPHRVWVFYKYQRILVNVNIGMILKVTVQGTDSSLYRNIHLCYKLKNAFDYRTEWLHGCMVTLSRREHPAQTEKPT